MKHFTQSISTSKDFQICTNLRHFFISRKTSFHGSSWQLFACPSSSQHLQPATPQVKKLRQLSKSTFYGIWHQIFQCATTVDGSEIRRSPVEVGSLSQLFTTGFSTIPGWDFFHQQYHQFFEGGPLISMVSEYIHLEFNMSPSSNCRNTFRLVDLALNQAAKPWFHQYLDPAWYHLWRFVSENVSRGQICNLNL